MSDRKKMTGRGMLVGVGAAAALVAGAGQAFALTTIRTDVFTSSGGGNRLGDFHISGSSVRVDFDAAGGGGQTVTITLYRNRTAFPDESHGSCSATDKAPDEYCTFTGLSNSDTFHVQYVDGLPGNGARVSYANP